MNLKKQIDFFPEFKKWYLEILDCFNFDYDSDCRARDLLSQILNEKEQPFDLNIVLESFKDAIDKSSNIIIYGCGPSLENTVGKLFPNEQERIFSNTLNYVADGATLLLKEYNIPINGIFTDLDGITENEFFYSDYMIVHAHGDNIDKLKYFKQNIIDSENLVGTAQCEPLDNILNPGGFTDGDRILFFLRSLLTDQRVFLIGMDFNDIIGRYSKPKMETQRKGSPIKLKKLEFAVELLEWLIPQLKNEVYFVNCIKSSNKFNYISIEEYKEMVK